MNEIISKNVKVTDNDTILNYSFTNIDNKKWIVNLVNSLVEEKVNVKRISVSEIGDCGDGIKVFSFKSISDYLSAFDRYIFDNSIEIVNITCTCNNIDFIIGVDAHLNQIQVSFFNYKGNVAFDEVINKTVSK